MPVLSLTLNAVVRWDFPMLALSAARHGETEQAIEWLLHPLFQFDDAGMPVGGVRVPTRKSFSWLMKPSMTSIASILSWLWQSSICYCIYGGRLGWK